MATAHHGSLDLATGRVTDYETGVTRSWFEWQVYLQNSRLSEFRRHQRERDLSSDLTNLPGRKPWFVDDWLYVWPTQVRPDPRTHF